MLRRAVSLFTALGILIAVSAPAQQVLNGHQVILDAQGKLLSWVQPQELAYDRVMRLAWDFLLHSVPVEPNGLKAYFTYCCLDSLGRHTEDWPHDPASVYAGLADSACAYYAYSGDRAVVTLVEELLDYDLAHGRTLPDWDWGNVPYASSDAGARDYRGADDVRYNTWCGKISLPGYTPPKLDWKGKGCGTGDGRYVIEPDKVGELAMGFLEFYELTGKAAYREAAVAGADALARHARSGDALHSPWPFRVYARTNRVREEYSSNVIGPIRLFDELDRLKLGDSVAYRKARQIAWTWMRRYPMRNDHWAGYFEDVEIFPGPLDFNQYSPLETARYILQHPVYDVNWRADVKRLIEVVEQKLVVDTPKEPAVQWAANAVSEQFEDKNKMGSHTARYASVNASWYALTSDAVAKEKAFRSFNWATYMCRVNGVVNVGPVDNSLWWADGYADYIRHFMAGLGWVPEWAPPGKNHLLRSSSVVQQVAYDDRSVQYRTYDPAATEVLRLRFKPATITAGTTSLREHGDLDADGYTVQTLPGGDFIVRVRHSLSGEIKISG